MRSQARRGPFAGKMSPYRGLSHQKGPGVRIWIRTISKLHSDKRFGGRGQDLCDAGSEVLGVGDELVRRNDLVDEPSIKSLAGKGEKKSHLEHGTHSVIAAPSKGNAPFARS